MPLRLSPTPKEAVGSKSCQEVFTTSMGIRSEGEQERQPQAQVRQDGQDAQGQGVQEEQSQHPQEQPG